MSEGKEDYHWWWGAEEEAGVTQRVLSDHL